MEQKVFLFLRINKILLSQNNKEREYEFITILSEGVYLIQITIISISNITRGTLFE